MTVLNDGTVNCKLNVPARNEPGDRGGCCINTAEAVSFRCKPDVMIPVLINWGNIIITETADFTGVICYLFADPWFCVIFVQTSSVCSDPDHSPCILIKSMYESAGSYRIKKTEGWGLPVETVQSRVTPRIDSPVCRLQERYERVCFQSQGGIFDSEVMPYVSCIRIQYINAVVIRPDP